MSSKSFTQSEVNHYIRMKNVPRFFEWLNYEEGLEKGNVYYKYE